MDTEPARLIIEALKEEKIDLFVTLPEEPTASLTQAAQERAFGALTARSPAEPPDRRVGFFIKTKRDSQFRRC